MTNATRLTHGVHHAGLTVPDIEKASAFFIEVLGFEQVGGKPEYPAVFVSDGDVMITLWQAEDPHTATRFDHKQSIGLHHLALRVDAASLDDVHKKLSQADDVNIEFPPELLGAGPTRHMMFYMPGGIRLELIAPVG